MSDDLKAKVESLLAAYDEIPEDFELCTSQNLIDAGNIADQFFSMRVPLAREYVKAAARIEELESRLTRAVRVLGPFAVWAEGMTDVDDEGVRYQDKEEIYFPVCRNLTVGDLRAARALIKELKGGAGC